MKQLSAFDSVFVYAEKGRLPLHVSPLMIYDPGTAPNRFVRFKDILRTFQERLHLSPVFRRKLVRVPFDLDEPYWVDDPDFDLESHVRHIALPRPGDRRQLNILLARIHNYPMDLSRPPWDAYVIEGLDNIEGLPKGCFAMLFRIHHAAIDGQSGHAVLQALHDLVPNPPPRSDVPDQPWTGESPPSRRQMLATAYVHLVAKPRRLAQIAGEVFPTAKRIREFKREQPHHELRAPVTRFSDKVSPHRIVLTIDLDLNEIRQMRKAVEGATVNDVIVAIIAGGLRQYLETKNELPDTSLTTLMPINIRTAETRHVEGNVVSISVMTMHTEIADPKERLQKVHESAVYSKAYHNAVGASIMSDVAQTLPAAVMSLGVRAASVAGLKRLPANTIVTNTPGAQAPLYFAGAKVVEFHAIGCLVDGLGVFHSVNSYCGRIAVTVLACRRMMPDPEFYARCLRDSYAQMRRATLGEAIAAPAAAQAKPLKKSRARSRVVADEQRGGALARGGPPSVDATARNAG